MIRNETEFYNKLDRILTDIELIAQFIRTNVENCHKTERLLTKTEAAEVLCVSERTVDRYREEGKLSCVIIRSKVFFSKECLWECVRKNTTKNSPKTREDFERNYQRFVIDKRNTTWRSKR